MTNKSKWEICQGRNICFLQALKHGWCWPGLWPCEAVGVLRSEASSFAAPVKVNRELSNGPVMLIKGQKRKPEPLSFNFRALFCFWVPLSLVHGLLARAPKLPCQRFYRMINATKWIHKVGTISFQVQLHVCCVQIAFICLSSCTSVCCWLNSWTNLKQWCGVILENGQRPVITVILNASWTCTLFWSPTEGE